MFKLELVPNRTTTVQSCPSYISAIKVSPLLFNPARDREGPASLETATIFAILWLGPDRGCGTRQANERVGTNCSGPKTRPVTIMERQSGPTGRWMFPVRVGLARDTAGLKVCGTGRWADPPCTPYGPRTREGDVSQSGIGRGDLDAFPCRRLEQSTR